MAFEDATTAERAYPYWSGWHVVGCAVLFFALLGSIGVALIPAGYERVQRDQLPTGVAMMVLGVFGIPTLAMSVVSLAGGVRNTLRPPLLRVTATAVVLPREARGDPPQDEYGEPISKEPPHPETIPFAAIRSVKRSGPAHNEVLEIVHELSASVLLLKQHMMRTADFVELETVLRACVPEAFAHAPPSAT